MPQVSVICTAYNASSTLAFAIDSITRQTFSDWEMILLDDGSDDDTTNIAITFCTKDSRIHLLRSSHIGRGRALNLAVNSTSSPVVLNLDADDEAHPQRIELQILALKNNPTFSLISTNSQFLHKLQRPLWKNYRLCDAEVNLVDVTRQLLFHNPINHSSIIAHKSAILDVGGYNESLKSHFDYDLWVRLAENGHRLGRLPKALSAKRLHGAQNFESNRRVYYLLESATIQSRAVHRLSGTWYHSASIAVRFAWGFLPRKIRHIFSFWERTSRLSRRTGSF